MPSVRRGQAVISGPLQDLVDAYGPDLASDVGRVCVLCGEPWEAMSPSVCAPCRVEMATYRERWWVRLLRWLTK